MWIFRAGITKRSIQHIVKVSQTQNLEQCRGTTLSLCSIDDHEPAHSLTNNRKLDVILDSRKQLPICETTSLNEELWNSLLVEKNNHQVYVQHDWKRLTERKSGENVKKCNVDRCWKSEDFSWSAEIRKKLKIFQVEDFFPNQLKAINATLSNRDVIVILATGGGKSLCYQLPALVSKGITVVVSPLVSLMIDQTLNAKKLGINAEMLSANTPWETVQHIYYALQSESPDIKLLYVTPEKIAKSKFFFTQLEKCYENGNLSRIGIDEVHCIKQWGNDFRPDYKLLGILKQQFPKTPIIGVTATSTAKDTEYVKDVLKIPDALVFQSSLKRDNLFYEVRQKPKTHKKLINDMASTIHDFFPGQSGIVYCLSRRNCTDVCRSLLELGITTGVYHAKVSPEERKSVYLKWKKGEIQVICATIAFGMGIDKPDVRFVFHHTFSKSVENYYQESGRAGRDGLPALCVLYFGFGDIFRHYRIMKETAGIQNLLNMTNYCHTTLSCRHKIISDHFDYEKDSWTICGGMCDVCTGLKDDNVSDVTSVCHALLDIVRSSVSKNEIISGAKLVKLYQKEVKQHTKEEVERIIVEMLSMDYLRHAYRRISVRFTISLISPGRKAYMLRHNKVELNLPKEKSTSVHPYRWVFEKQKRNLLEKSPRRVRRCATVPLKELKLRDWTQQRESALNMEEIEAALAREIITKPTRLLT